MSVEQSTLLCEQEQEFPQGRDECFTVFVKYIGERQQERVLPFALIQPLLSFSICFVAVSNAVCLPLHVDVPLRDMKGSIGKLLPSRMCIGLLGRAFPN